MTGDSYSGGSGQEAPRPTAQPRISDSFKAVSAVITRASGVPVAAGSPAGAPMSFDEMWMTPAVELAHSLFRDHLPGAAFDGEPFMGTAEFELYGKRLVACSCFYHTVVFFENRDVTHAAVYTIEEGGMVPWVHGVPDPSMLQTVFQLPNQPFEEFLEASDMHRARVEAQDAAEHAAQDAVTRAAQQAAREDASGLAIEQGEQDGHDYLAPRG